MWRSSPPSSRSQSNLEAVPFFGTHFSTRPRFLKYRTLDPGERVLLKDLFARVFGVEPRPPPSRRSSRSVCLQMLCLLLCGISYSYESKMPGVSVRKLPGSTPRPTRNTACWLLGSGGYRYFRLVRCCVIFCSTLFRVCVLCVFNFLSSLGSKAAPFVLDRSSGMTDCCLGVGV